MPSIYFFFTIFVQLSPCPGTPNCVSTQSPDDRGPAPLTVIGARAQAMAAIRQLLTEQKRTRMISQKGDYLHVEMRSAVFRFVDDVEFLIDADSRLQFRSAARIGKWDLGVNRRRMVRIRKNLLRRYGSIFRDDGRDGRAH